MLVKVILFLLSITNIFLKKSSTSSFTSFSFYFLLNVFERLKKGVHLLVIYAFISWPLNKNLNTFERILGKQHEVK